jgi:hypothetical protein
VPDPNHPGKLQKAYDFASGEINML